MYLYGVASATPVWYLDITILRYVCTYCIAWNSGMDAYFFPAIFSPQPLNMTGIN